MNTTFAPPPLTAAERCDRCGARAYVRATLPGGGELLFCAHHWRAHRDALTARSAVLHDESHTLNATTPANAPDDER